MGARVQVTPLNGPSRRVVEPRLASTDDKGRFSLLGLEPGIYSLRVDYAGFLPAEHASLTILTGQPTAVQVQLSPVPGETVTVTGEPPSLAGEPAALPTLTLRREELDRTPNARDPWSVATRAPGVVPLGVNNGGTESGGQFYIIGGGATAAENAYMVDGIPVTDLIFAGSSIGYFDFEQFEQVGVSIGSLDLASGNAGVTVHLTTRSPTERWRGSARIFAADGAWQAEGTRAQQKLAARVGSLAEYGAEGGGPLLPLWRRSAGSLTSPWLWASAGGSQVERTNANDVPVNIELRNLALKGAAAWSRGSVSLVGQSNERLWEGRGVSVSRPLASTSDLDGPMRLYRGTATVLLSPDATLDGAVGGTEGDIRWRARSDGDTVLGSDGVWRGAARTNTRDSQTRQAQAEGGSRFTAFGSDNNGLRVGLQWRDQEDALQNFWGPRGTTVYQKGIASPLGSLLDVAQFAPQEMREQYRAAWLGGSSQYRRWSWQLGLRYDHQGGETGDAAAPAHAFHPDLLPAFARAGSDYGFEWESVTPRFAGTVALDAEGRTLLRFGAGQSASQLSTWVGLWQMVATERHAFVVFDDLDRNDRLDPLEPVHSTDFNISDGPDGGVDPNLQPELYDSLSLGIERQISGLRFTLDGAWRRNHRVLDERRLVRDGDTIRQAVRADYTRSSFVSGTLPDGEDYTVEVFGLAPELKSAGVLLTNGDRERRYAAVTLGVERPWQGRWSLRSNVTVADWSWRLGDEFVHHDDPTNIAFSDAWVFGVDPADDDGDVAGDFLALANGAGVITNARWSYSLVGRLALLRDTWAAFDVAASLTGREGFALGYGRQVVAPDGSPKFVQVTERSDRYRTDSLHLLDLRVEKGMRIAGLEATLGIDVFNALGSEAVLQRIRQAGPRLGLPSELVSPRIFRLGLRVSLDR